VLCVCLGEWESKCGHENVYVRVGGCMWVWVRLGVCGDVSFTSLPCVQAGVEDWEQLQSIQRGGEGGGRRREEEGVSGAGALHQGGLSVHAVVHLLRASGGGREGAAGPAGSFIVGNMCDS
jgi:hypothetical protein